MARRLTAAALGAALGLALVASPAVGAPEQVTRMDLELGDEVPSGSNLEGSVQVWTRSGNEWVGFVGATLSVVVDGVQVGTVVTDQDGLAALSYTTGEPGNHVMKVVFAGDGLHKKAQRAEGFTVTPAESPDPGDPPPGSVPNAPFLISAVGGTGVVSLMWTTPADGGSPITGYRVYRGFQSGVYDLLTELPVQNTYEDVTVVSAIPHFYVVTALNAVGESANSNEFAVTPG